MSPLPKAVQGFLWWIPAIVCYGVITWFSSQSGLPRPEGAVHQFVWFKSGHIVVYSTLTASLWLAWWKNGWQGTRLELVTWYTLIIACSIDEFHQRFTPGRTSRLLDIFIDLLAAWAVLQVLKRYNRPTPLGSGM